MLFFSFVCLFVFLLRETLLWSMRNHAFCSFHGLFFYYFHSRNQNSYHKWFLSNFIVVLGICSCAWLLANIIRGVKTFYTCTTSRKTKYLPLLKYLVLKNSAHSPVSIWTSKCNKDIINTWENIPVCQLMLPYRYFPREFYAKIFFLAKVQWLKQQWIHLFN